MTALIMEIATRFEDFASRLLPARRARLVRRAAALVLLLGAPAFLGAQGSRAARPAIQMEQVVAALDLAMLPLENAVVRLLAQNTATTPQPGLEVRALEPWGDRGARVRLGCAAHEQCLPFYVAIDWRDPAAARAALRSATLAPSVIAHKMQTAQPPIEASKRVPDVAHALAPGREAAAALKVDPVLTSEAANVHPGSHATLLIDGLRVHIKVPVICLESGAPGRTVRVTALDHKQSYQAEVIDGTLLKTTL